MLKTQEPYNQFSENDEIALRDLCNSITKDKAVFCEIGCWLGHSTSIIAKRAKELGGKVICIDTFMGSKGTFLTEYAERINVLDSFCSNMKELGFIDYLNIFRMTSDDAVIFLDDNKIDFLFIDGDHIYEQTKRDIDNYLPKVKEGGIISGHDYEKGFDLDVDFFIDSDLDKDMSRGFHCGVIKAVNDKFKDFNLSGDRVWWVKK